MSDANSNTSTPMPDVARSPFSQRRVKRVIQAITDEAHGQHGQEDGNSRERYRPGRIQDEVQVVANEENDSVRRLTGRIALDP